MTTAEHVPCDPPCETPAQPTGYIAWHEWASRMNYRGYTQSRCPKCGLYTIWSR